MTIILTNIFGFAEHQLKGMVSLGYKLTLTRDCDNAVLNKSNTINNAKIGNNSIDWYVPHYTPSLEQQTVLSSQIVKKIPTELQCIERSVFMMEVNTHKIWTFELGTQEGINVPIWFLVGFQQSHRQQDQNLYNDTL